MRAIIDYQKKFFTDGDENDLKPMILKDISEIILFSLIDLNTLIISNILIIRGYCASFWIKDD